MNKKLAVMFVLFSYYNIYGLSDAERVILENEIPNELTDIEKIILQNEVPDYKAISKNGFLEITINKNTNSGKMQIEIKTKDKEKKEYINFLITTINKLAEEVTKLSFYQYTNSQPIETKKNIIKTLQKILENI